MHHDAVLIRLGNHIYCSRVDIDDGSRDYAFFGVFGDGLAGQESARSSSDPGGRIGKICVPKRRGVVSAIVISVKGIDAIVQGGYVDDIMCARPRYRYIGQVERLANRKSIYILFKQ